MDCCAKYASVAMQQNTEYKVHNVVHRRTNHQPRSLFSNATGFGRYLGALVENNGSKRIRKKEKERGKKEKKRKRKRKGGKKAPVVARAGGGRS